MSPTNSTRDVYKPHDINIRFFIYRYSQHPKLKMSAIAVMPLPNVASKPSEGEASQDSPKRNKRKSHGPKKVPSESSGVARKIKFSPTENNGETSDGEERNQSMGSASPDSCGSEGQAIHPKKRFKQDPAFMDFSSSPSTAASTRSLPLLIPLPQSPTAPSSHW